MKIYLRSVFFLVLTCNLYGEIISIPRNFREVCFPEFLKSSHTRRDDYPILSVETFRAHADFILDETIWTIDTDELFDGCVIFVGLRSLKDFYISVLPHIKNKVIVVSHGGEPFHISSGLTWDTYIGSEYDLASKLAENSNVVAFFGKNVLENISKCFSLPLGKAYWCPEHTPILKKSATNLNIGRFFREKRITMYLNMNVVTHKSRGPILDHWKKQLGVFYSPIKKFPAYFSDLQNSKFILSPRGYGVDCIRTWEALYAGSIPVMESCGMDSLYEDLPVILVDDLTKVTIEDLEKEYKAMKNREYNLEKLFADFWLNKIRLMGREG